MQFAYHSEAGVALLRVDIREYEHLFKVRRMGVGSVMVWRNLEDNYAYEYRLTQMGKKEALWELQQSQEVSVLPLKSLQIGWCMIDPKIIEKTLPMLNELGVEKISFVYAAFSQKNHKLDYERMKRILINSSQQCGRTRLMILEEYASLKAYLEAYPQSVIIDFSETKLVSTEAVQSCLIGPEGGFSDKEREMVQSHKILGLTCNTILRSETAVVSVCAKILA